MGPDKSCLFFDSTRRLLYLCRMLLSRFTGLMLFFLGIFLIPAGTAQACEMHQQTAKAAKENKDQPGTDKKMDCCKQHSAKHQHKKEIAMIIIAPTIIVIPCPFPACMWQLQSKWRLL